MLRLRYGLSGRGPMTLKAVGQHIGRTTERIRQIESQGFRKLRAQPGFADLNPAR